MDLEPNSTEPLRRLTEESKKYFRNPLAEFIFYRTYSRWIESEKRRETWIETVDRYFEFMREGLGDRLTPSEYATLRSAVLEQQIMPSMRLLWSAGSAARATNVSAYNCAYIAPTEIKDFAEIMYLLMCGTGVGFSVEDKHVRKLPVVVAQRGERASTHTIMDSKEGWCEALRLGLTAWFSGGDMAFDFSQLRPAGARLQVMGGRSSGPEPLRAALAFARDTILASQGRRLLSIEVHDIVCKIAEAIVMGGVRRSALLSLSDLGDESMRSAKVGEFFRDHPERAMANNSAAYDTKPSRVDFMDEWSVLRRSGTGERGIFNRGSLEKQLPERRWQVLEPHSGSCGTNPCGEIILRSKQFCNLTEVVARAEDTEETLLQKIEWAAMLGTYQATLTNFAYLSPEWKSSCEEERLLGVSLTGQWDSAVARQAGMLERLRERAVAVNRKYAERIGINAATAVTCVKPSGTVSQLVDSSSGVHPRYSRYYVRRVRISALDPLFAMLKAQNFPYRPEVGQDPVTASTYVLEFPVASPEGAVTRSDLSALDQLEHWKKVKIGFTEHNPSVTISVARDEWDATAEWVYENWDQIGGLSFLPKEEHTYQLAPYEELSKQEYDTMLASLPQVDFSGIIAFEKEDNTVGERVLACTGDACALDPEDLPKN